MENEEKERIKQIIGKIGGTSLKVSTKFLPAYISLEISVLLVSIKIVWMIHSQDRSNHFAFWILNTLEFRLSDIAKSIRTLETSLQDNGRAEL